MNIPVQVSTRQGDNQGQFRIETSKAVDSCEAAAGVQSHHEIVWGAVVFLRYGNTMAQGFQNTSPAQRCDPIPLP
jgi:hypothetical protein